MCVCSPLRIGTVLAYPLASDPLNCRKLARHMVGLFKTNGTPKNQAELSLHVFLNSYELIQYLTDIFKEPSLFLEPYPHASMRSSGLLSEALSACGDSRDSSCDESVESIMGIFLDTIRSCDMCCAI